WGPDDDGKTVDGPHQLGKAALQHGVIAGRRGFGSIFVVASGNGGPHSDNCNYDGYANSIYTVTIGAVDETGSMPFYAEECASMLAVTFSGGDKMMRSIVTGMIALMLQVRPCLTWRDVQHIIVFTATK
ncbi:PREDICTED: proprotein convertase subtilisin/kexin type 7-like, partial [Chlamydotis macqueenii]|uniref:proprotein convertase subtilisin/kexin type 7-like n=1 Tax=Chlamydotis macqueenii TaxID=187382 RepID=UPI000529E07F